MAKFDDCTLEASQESIQASLDEFDEWQDAQRRSLQNDVAEAAAEARRLRESCPHIPVEEFSNCACYRAAGVAYAMALYERMTRDVETMEGIAEMNAVLERSEQLRERQLFRTN